MELEAELPSYFEITESTFEFFRDIDPPDGKPPFIYNFERVTSFGDDISLYDYSIDDEYLSKLCFR